MSGKKKKEIKRNKTDRWILHHLPASFVKRWEKKLEESFRYESVNRRENNIALEEFQLRQIRVLYRGILICFLTVILLCISSFVVKKFSFRRNAFGRGEQEIQLTLDHEGKKEEISFILEEQQLSQEEEEKVFRDFFRKLKKEMKGKNTSLQKVNQPLNFEEKLEGYPFSVIYEPLEIGLIDWNGEPGEEARNLKEGERRDTKILVEASYKEYSRKEEIPVTLIPGKKAAMSLFDRFQEMLNRREGATRKDSEFTVDTSWKDIRIRQTSQENLWKLPLLTLGITGLLLAQGYSRLREKKRKHHKQNMEDFPLIVHLLTLYMGAGLSFSSAVTRICNDYEKRMKFTGERYAFEQICVMDRCLHMGLRPKEACLEWGNCFPEKEYARFAMLLTQGFSKGAREIRSMMEKEQQDVFQAQVDFVRREGEEASTRLILPMVVLLFIIMVLIIFPAFMQFTV